VDKVFFSNESIIFSVNREIIRKYDDKNAGDQLLSAQIAKHFLTGEVMK